MKNLRRRDWYMRMGRGERERERAHTLVDPHGTLSLFPVIIYVCAKWAWLCVRDAER